MQQFDNTLLVAISDAIRHIAQTNDQSVSNRVQQERDGIVEAHDLRGAQTMDFSADLAWEIRQQHDRWAVDKLFDYVQILLWLKLRRECKHERVIDDADPFLGISDLRSHLMSRAPKVYARAWVQGFLRQHHPPHSIGDLRNWLVRSRHVYTDRQVDDDLRDELNLEERGMPVRLFEYALDLTKMLVTGSCACPRCSDTPATKFRGYHDAEKRCRETHFLSAENLPTATKDRRDPLSFVERAITGGCTAFEARGFAHSMFCAIYVTPDGRTLRLDEHGRLIVTDRHYRLDDDDDGGGGRSIPQTYPCLGCHEHRAFVSDLFEAGEINVCRRDRHTWMYAAIRTTEDPDEKAAEDPDEKKTVRINVCPAQHLWPFRKGGRLNSVCPVCGLNASKTNCEFPIAWVYPAHRDFDDIEWKPELPRV